MPTFGPENRWYSKLLEIIQRQWRIGEVFTTSELNRFHDELAREFPNNTVIEKNILHFVQRLEEGGEIQMLFRTDPSKKGQYKRLK